MEMFKSEGVTGKKKMLGEMEFEPITLGDRAR